MVHKIICKCLYYEGSFSWLYLGIISKSLALHNFVEDVHNIRQGVLITKEQPVALAIATNDVLSFVESTYIKAIASLFIRYNSF